MRRVNRPSGWGERTVNSAGGRDENGKLIPIDVKAVSVSGLMTQTKPEHCAIVSVVHRLTFPAVRARQQSSAGSGTGWAPPHT